MEEVEQFKAVVTDLTVPILTDITRRELDEGEVLVKVIATP
jgi:hypothetical protein